MSRLADSPVHAAKGAGRDFVYSTTFEVLSRAGFVARGLIYGIIGVLAFLVAVSDKGKLTDQEGAIQELADKPFGTFLLVVLAIGLGGYAIWRLTRAAIGHGPEASDSTLDRLGGVGAGSVYAALCIATIKILDGLVEHGLVEPGQDDRRCLRRPGRSVADRHCRGRPHRRRRLPARQGPAPEFLEELKTEQMQPAVKTWITRIGTVGHVARAVVFALIGCSSSRRRTSSTPTRRSASTAP